MLIQKKSDIFLKILAFIWFLKCFFRMTKRFKGHKNKLYGRMRTKGHTLATPVIEYRIFTWIHKDPLKKYVTLEGGGPPNNQITHGGGKGVNQSVLWHFRALYWTTISRIELFLERKIAFFWTNIFAKNLTNLAMVLISTITSLEACFWQNKNSRHS